MDALTREKIPRASSRFRFLLFRLGCDVRARARCRSPSATLCAPLRPLRLGNFFLFLSSLVVLLPYARSLPRLCRRTCARLCRYSAASPCFIIDLRRRKLGRIVRPLDQSSDKLPRLLFFVPHCARTRYTTHILFVCVCARIWQRDFIQ